MKKKRFKQATSAFSYLSIGFEFVFIFLFFIFLAIFLTKYFPLLKKYEPFLLLFATFLGFGTAILYLYKRMLPLTQKGQYGDKNSKQKYDEEYSDENDTSHDAIAKKKHKLVNEIDRLVERFKRTLPK